LTQAELAQRAGVDQGTISRIENGLTRGVGFGILERLAEALGVSCRSLLAYAAPALRAAYTAPMELLASSVVPSAVQSEASPLAGTTASKRSSATSV